jgi:potassium-transporting ATPase KdpC subunit
MKKYLLPSIKMTIAMLFLCCAVYFGLVWLIGKASPGSGDGVTIMTKGKIVGYYNIGQSFTNDQYFWGRPSSIDYNAAGSGGSNKGPSNPEYLATVNRRIDTFLAHHPDISKNDIPAEMVTASGSGLDPHISPSSAYIQIPKIAKARKMEADSIRKLVDMYVEENPVGPDKVNVLRLNVALDELKQRFN